MSRWLPRSLFARMVLVLLGGLVVAQLASFGIYWQERVELAMHAGGMRSLQRIADIVRLLDTLTPPERARVVGVLSSPPLRIALEAAPRPARAAPDPAQQERAAALAAALARLLGPEREVRVELTETLPWGGPPTGYGMGRR